MANTCQTQTAKVAAEPTTSTTVMVTGGGPRIHPPRVARTTLSYVALQGVGAARRTIARLILIHWLRPYTVWAPRLL